MIPSVIRLLRLGVLALCCLAPALALFLGFMPQEARGPFVAVSVPSEGKPVAIGVKADKSDRFVAQLVVNGARWALLPSVWERFVLSVTADGKPVAVNSAVTNFAPERSESRIDLGEFAVRPGPIYTVTLTPLKKYRPVRGVLCLAVARSQVAYRPGVRRSEQGTLIAFVSIGLLLPLGLGLLAYRLQSEKGART